MSITVMMNPTQARRAVTRCALQRGLSLMELMVGLGIGMVLTLGMFTMIVSTSQSFRINDDFSRMQENAASAFRYLGDSLRQSGFYGSSQDTTSMKFVAASAVATTTDCGSATVLPTVNFALDFRTSLRAYMHNDPFVGVIDPLTVHGLFPCIPVGNFSAGPVGFANPNPILVTRGAGGFRICNAIVAAVPNVSPACSNTQGLLTAQPNYTTNIYIQASPYSGIVFYGGNYATITAGTDGLKYTNGIDMEMFEYRAHVYYVRPCSRPFGGAVACTGASDDDGQPIPTLVRQELVGSAMTEVPLVEGIEVIDYRFGVDTTGDGVADFYTNNVVAAAQWQLVVSVKITMLVRSPHINNEYDDSAKTYDLLGDNVSAIYVCTNQPVPATACKYKRKVFSQTIQVRNIAQRIGA